MKSKRLKFILVSMLFIAFVVGGVFAVYRTGIPGLLSELSSERNSNPSDNEDSKDKNDDPEDKNNEEMTSPSEEESEYSDLGEVSYKPVDNDTLVDTDTWGPIPLNQIAVMFTEEDEDLLDEVLTLVSGKVVGGIDYIGLYQIEFAAMDATTFDLLLASVQVLEGVESAFPNSLVASQLINGQPCTPFNDPVFDTAGNRRPYEMIGMEGAWKIIKLSGVKLNKTRVGVMDTSLYSGSDELGGKTKFIGDSTKDAKEDSNGYIENNGNSHGTLVTHVIAANKDNGGVSGVASILGDKLTVEVEDIFTGPEYTNSTTDDNELYVGQDTSSQSYVLQNLVKYHKLIKGGSKVINCSFNPRELVDDNKWVAQAYRKFFTKIAKDYPNVVIVASAGNHGNADKSAGAITSDNNFPGGLKLPNVITVGALNNDGSRADFSSFATGDAEVTLSAPGVQVTMGVDFEGNPVQASGTSFAAPMVAGTIALLQSINPKITATEIKKYLTESSAPGTTNGETSIPIPEGMGSGVLQMDGAVLALINDMRVKDGLAPIDKNNLNDLSSVTLSGEPIGGGTVEGSTGEYRVSATAPQILSGKTTLTIDVGGQFFMGGDTVQQAAPGEEVVWEIETFDLANDVKVTRADASTCALMTLENLDITGVWDTTLTITYDTFIPMIIESIGQSIDEFGDEMGCEPGEGSSETGDDTILGMEIEMILDIKAEDSEGIYYSLTMANKEGSESAIDFSEVADIIYGEKQSDGSVLFVLETSDDGTTSYLSFELKSGGEDQLLGDFMLYMEGANEEFVFTSNERLEASVDGKPMAEPLTPDGETTTIDGEATTTDGETTTMDEETTTNAPSN